MKQVSPRKAAKYKKIKLATIFSILFLTGALGTLYWIGNNVYKIIKEPEYTGALKLIISGERWLTKNDDIQQAISTLGNDKTYLSYDVTEIRNAVKTLPWIKDVRVRKEWPDLLKIDVIEFTPIAYWNDLSFLDKEATVFRIPEERLSGDFYPYLYGPAGTEKDVLTMYNRLVELLKKTPYLTINQLCVNERYSWTVIINNQLNIELGRTDIDERLLRFAELYYDVIYPMLPTESIIYIDLRYSSGMAIKQG